MLPRASRLLNDRDFQKIYKHGKRVMTPHLRIFYLPLAPTASRFGFVVPGREVKNIVERNRLKRLWRAELRRILPQLREGYGVIVLPSRKSLTLPPAARQAELARVLQAAGLLPR